MMKAIHAGDEPSLADLFDGELQGLVGEGGWNLDAFADDYSWEASAKKLLNDPGWRFSLRFWVDGDATYALLGEPFRWLREVRKQLAASYDSFHTQYGLEIRPAVLDCFNGVPVEIASMGMRGEATFLNAIDRQEYSNGWRFLREDREGAFYCGYENQWLKEYAYRMDYALSTRDAADFKLRIANYRFVAQFPPEWPHA